MLVLGFGLVLGLWLGLHPDAALFSVSFVFLATSLPGVLVIVLGLGLVGHD